MGEPARSDEVDTACLGPEEGEKGARGGAWRGWLKAGAVVAILAGLFIAGRVVDLKPLVEATRQWVHGLGYWGPLVYVGIYVGAMLVALPGTPLTVLAALLFGNALGFGVMVAATTASAALSFLIARYFARDAVQRRVERLKLLRRFNDLLADNHWFVIPAAHLAPFCPFALTNYCFGLSKIGFWRYMLLAELVMVPMNFVWVFGTNALFGAASGNGSAWMFAATAGLSVLVVLLGWWAKRVLAGRK